MYDLLQVQMVYKKMHMCQMQLSSVQRRRNKIRNRNTNMYFYKQPVSC